MFDGYITSIENNSYETISRQLLNLLETEENYKLEQQNDFGKTTGFRNTERVES